MSFFGRKAWSEAEDAALEKHFVSGLTYAQISELMGRSASGCQQRAFNLGFKRGHRNQYKPIKLSVEALEGDLPTLPYVPGIVVTGRYQMVAP